MKVEIESFQRNNQDMESFCIGEVFSLGSSFLVFSLIDNERLSRRHNRAQASKRGKRFWTIVSSRWNYKSELPLLRARLLRLLFFHLCIVSLGTLFQDQELFF